jgi:hypothetical protein
MILNEELEIAKELSDARCVLKIPYAEAASIVDRLRALAADPAAYMLACDSARELYNLHYDWIKVRSDSLIALTGQ